MSAKRKGLLLIGVGVMLLLILIGSVSSPAVAAHTAAFMGVMGFIGAGLLLLYSQVGK